MRSSLSTVVIALLALGALHPLRAQQMSVMLASPAESLYARALAVLASDGYVVERADARTQRIAALTSDRSVRAIIAVDPQKDSTRLVITAAPTRAEGTLSAMRTLISLMHAISRPTSAAETNAPEGDDWPTDVAGRVGFMIVGPWLANEFDVRPGDTIPEIRPSQVPPDFRREIERTINDVGFNASCARFFRTGHGPTERWAVRFNMCAEPTPDLDRLEIFDAARNSLSLATGSSISEDIRIMCPARRGSLPPSSACPVPFR